MKHKYWVIIGCLILLCLSREKLFSEIIMLKNGEYLQGKILSHDEYGFALERWDTGAVVMLKWHHLIDSEAKRIRALLNVKLPEDELDGLKVFLKDGKIYTGVILQQNEVKLTLKTLSGILEINRDMVLKEVSVTLARFEVYTPEEIYEQEKTRYDLTKAADNYKLGIYCLETLKLYNKAIEHLKIAAADPNYKSKAEEKLSQLVGFIVQPLISHIEQTLKEGNTSKARELLNQLKNQVSEFTTADPNIQKLIEDIENKITDRERNIISKKEGDLRKKVISKWDKLIQENLRKIAYSKEYSYGAATMAVQNILPGQIKRTIATDLKLEEPEVERIWLDRKLEESNKNSATYGNGSWIVAPPLTAPSSVEEVPKFQEKLRRINQAKQEAIQNKKLLTADAWWNSASSAERYNWLLAFFAERQMKVLKKELKPCPTCRGEGVLSKSGKFELCPRCQGTTVEITIIYY